MAQVASAMHVLARATPHPVAMSSGSDASSRHRVFVYGTLKRGFYNHRLLQEREAKFVGNASTREPMRLVLGEYGIPYLMKGEGNTAVPGELWEVDDAGLDALDVLEVGGVRLRELYLLLVVLSAETTEERLQTLYLHGRALHALLQGASSARRGCCACAIFPGT